MNTSQIRYILSRDQCTKKTFAGVFPANFIGKIRDDKCPAAYIFNTDPDWMPGQHWIAIYKRCHGEPLEYFDSYGLKPFPAFAPHLEDAVRSRRRIQGLLTTCCGQYCIFYVLMRCRGYSMKQIVDMFSGDSVWNDAFVTGFVNKHFNLNTVVLSADKFMQTSIKY
jgi:hypothetical protein